MKKTGTVLLLLGLSLFLYPTDLVGKGLAGVLLGVGACTIWKGNRRANLQAAGTSATRSTMPRLDEVIPPAVWSFPDSDEGMKAWRDQFVDGVIHRLSGTPDIGEPLEDQKVRHLNDDELSAALRILPPT